MNNMVLNLLSKVNPQMASLNEIVSQIKAASNPMAALTSMAQNNPQLQQVTNLISQNGGNVQQAVYSMAQQRGVNVQDLLNQARSMM